MSNIIVQGNEINARKYLEKITIEGIGEEKTLNPRIIIAGGGSLNIAVPDEIESFTQLLNYFYFVGVLTKNDYDVIINLLSEYSNVHAIYDPSNFSLMMEATNDLSTIAMGYSSNVSGYSTSYPFTSSENGNATMLILQIGGNGCVEVRKATCNGTVYSGYSASSLYNKGYVCYNANFETYINKWKRINLNQNEAYFYYTQSYDDTLIISGTSISLINNSNFKLTKQLNKI